VEWCSLVGTFDLDVSTFTCTDGLSSSGSGSKLGRAGTGAILGTGIGITGGSMGVNRGGAGGGSGVGSCIVGGSFMGGVAIGGAKGSIGNTCGAKRSGFP